MGIDCTRGNSIRVVWNPEVLIGLVIDRVLTGGYAVAMTPRQAARVEALRNAPLDSWIALSNDESRIVAVAKTMVEVQEELRRTGELDAVILKTPKEWLPLAL